MAVFSTSTSWAAGIHRFNHLEMNKFLINSADSGPMSAAKQTTNTLQQATPMATSITNRAPTAGSSTVARGASGSGGHSVSRKENSTPVNIKVIESATKIGQLGRNISALQKRLESFAL